MQAVRAVFWGLGVWPFLGGGGIEGGRVDPPQKVHPENPEFICFCNMQHFGIEIRPMCMIARLAHSMLLALGMMDAGIAL